MRALFNIAYWLVGAVGLAWIAINRLMVGDLPTGLAALAAWVIMGAAYIWPEWLWTARAGEGVGFGWRLDALDDGSFVDLDSVSGGAAAQGAWGTLTLRFTAADGTQTLRKYTAGPAVRADLHQEATRT